MATITLTMTTAGRNAIGQSLMNGTSCQITWVALGTGSTAPAVTDTALVTEFYRLPIISVVAGASAGEVLLTASLDPGAAVSATIAEVGCFGGPLASSSSGTGTLFARGLWSHTHGSEVINFVCDLIF